MVRNLSRWLKFVSDLRQGVAGRCRGWRKASGEEGSSTPQGHKGCPDKTTMATIWTAPVPYLKVQQRATPQRGPLLGSLTAGVEHLRSATEHRKDGRARDWNTSDPNDLKSKARKIIYRRRFRHYESSLEVDPQLRSREHSLNNFKV